MNFNTPGMGTHGSTWQANGYSGCGNVAELIDSAKGRPALIVGSSYQVFADYGVALTKFTNPLIFATNDVGMYLPVVDHWVTLHRHNLPAWKAVRWLHPKPVQDTKYHSYECAEVDPTWYTWDHLNPIFALSGYFAMQIAYLMGCEPIILCGCPGTAGRRFFEFDVAQTDIYRNDGGVRQQLISEMMRLPEFRAKVRSMSGWTREFFGGISTWRHSRR